MTKVRFDENDDRGCCKTSVLQQQPIKNAVLQPIGRKTARACAKPTGFCNRLNLVDICYDNVFKAVFTKSTPESQGALSHLVSALIGREVRVEKITANEPPIDNLKDRQIRFDIACKAETGEPANVEMSLNPDPFEPVRATLSL